MQVSSSKWQSMKMHLPLLEQHFFDVQQLFVLSSFSIIHSFSKPIGIEWRVEVVSEHFFVN